MNMNVVVRDTATPAITAMEEAIQPENILPFMAELVTQEVQQNLRDLDVSRANRLGGERTHYFAQAAEETEWTMEGNDHAIVSVRQIGIALKYFGGTVTAGVGTSCATGEKTRFLTIPVHPSAYGVRACDIPGLKVISGPRGPFALGFVTVNHIGHESGGSTRTREVEIFYLLKESIEIAADKAMLPSPTRLAAVVGAGLRDYSNMVVENIRQAASERSESAVLSGITRSAQQARNLHLAGT
jgi:hypothetical protein